jgi:small subunit ribosomal protein S10
LAAKGTKKENSMCYSLQITLKAFEWTLLERASELLYNLAKKIKLMWSIKDQNFVFSSSFLPSKMKRFTVLRSPHIDKKSREQFEIKTYKKLFLLQTNQKKMFSLFLFLLKNISLSGVQFRVKLQYTSTL